MEAGQTAAKCEDGLSQSGEDWPEFSGRFPVHSKHVKNTLAAPVGAFNILDPESNLWIPLKMFTVHTTNIFFHPATPFHCIPTNVLLVPTVSAIRKKSVMHHWTLCIEWSGKQKHLSLLPWLRKKTSADEPDQYMLPPKYYKVLAPTLTCFLPALAHFL